MRSMSALRLLFGFRKEVPSHVIVDIRLLVLLFLKGFTVAAVLLLFSLSYGEAKNEAGHSTETHDPTKRDSPRRKKVKDGERVGETNGGSFVVLLPETRTSMTSPSLLIVRSNLVVAVNGAHLRRRFMYDRAARARDALNDEATMTRLAIPYGDTGGIHRRPEQNRTEQSYQVRRDFTTVEL